MTLEKRKFQLIGYPLGHSMSPPIHRALFALSGDRDAEYTLCEIPPERLDKEAAALFSLSGFNITIPHKMQIIKHLDALSESARRYGSVNVVKCGEKNIGYNTDADGFLRAMDSLGVSFDGASVLLLGCGGVGRMMAIESACRGAALTIAALPSDFALAQRAIDDILLLHPAARVRLIDVNRISGTYDLMINATPVGMYPNTEASPVSGAAAGRVKYLFDAIYNPEETLLMRYAKRGGAKVLGGMAMLVWQAVVAHEIWDGVSYSNEEIEALIGEMQTKLREMFPQNEPAG